MSKIEVFYEDWQYDCCGPYFSVGEYIWWPIEIGNYQKIINNKKRIVKYFCETHGGGIDRYFSGKVKKIEAICGNEYFECKDTREIKEMGYSFLVTLDNVEEFLINEIGNINGLSNPFIIDKTLNKKIVYTKINLIGDLNKNALSIAKKFKENHYEVNFYYKKNLRKHKEIYNELKNIRSYSTSEYYYLNAFGDDNNKNNFSNALNIIISEKNDYTYFYDFLLKCQENVYDTLSICYIKCNKDNYEIDFNFDNFKKRKLLMSNKYRYSKKLSGIKSIIKTEEELINFISDKTYKKIKIINRKKRILFFFVLWIIIKIITLLVRY